MKVKTADLIGPALDWAVAHAQGLPVVIVTVEDQAVAHEQVMRDHYSDAEWQEHLIEWNKHVRPTLRTRLAVLDSEGFPNGNPFMQNGRGVPLAFSTDWSQGGPIIEREKVEILKGRPLLFVDGTREALWIAKHQRVADRHPNGVHGPTPLIAAMRCYVFSKLGDKVDIPEELL